MQTYGYCTDVYFDAAIDFIDDAITTDEPFFAYIPTNAPHGPYHDVPEALYRKYKSKDLSPILLGNENDEDTVARVFAMVENVDQNVGKLLGHLNRRQIAENTIVIFYGRQRAQYTTLTSSIPGARRTRCTMVEYDLLFFSFVGLPQIEPGTRNDRIAAHIDVMPTLLEAAGATLPIDHPFDGRSILSLLKGERVDWPDRSLVLQVHRGNEPIPMHHIAVREQRWKLIHLPDWPRH